MCACVCVRGTSTRVLPSAPWSLYSARAHASDAYTFLITFISKSSLFSSFSAGTQHSKEKKYLRIDLRLMENKPRQSSFLKFSRLNNSISHAYKQRKIDFFSSQRRGSTFARNYRPLFRAERSRTRETRCKVLSMSRYIRHR